MTSKAKYIGRCADKYDRDSVELEYEYKGETYWIHIPLAWQHRNEQARIDKELELREKRTLNLRKQLKIVLNIFLI